MRNRKALKGFFALFLALTLFLSPSTIIHAENYKDNSMNKRYEGQNSAPNDFDESISLGEDENSGKNDIAIDIDKSEDNNVENGEEEDDADEKEIEEEENNAEEDQGEIDELEVSEVELEVVENGFNLVDLAIEDDVIVVSTAVELNEAIKKAFTGIWDNGDWENNQIPDEIIIRIDNPEEEYFILDYHNYTLDKDLKIHIQYDPQGSQQFRLENNELQRKFLVNNEAELVMKFTNIKFTNDLSNAGGFHINGGKFSLIGDNYTIQGSSKQHYLYGGRLRLENMVSAYIENVEFNTSVAKNQGGSILIENSKDVRIKGVTITSSQAELGGGIYIENSDVTIEDSKINDNKADSGGGIFIASGTLNVDDSELTYNESSARGGAIGHDSSADPNLQLNINITESKILNNSAVYGGAIHINTDVVGNNHSYNKENILTLSGTTVKENTSSQYGGGIYVKGVDISISNSDFIENIAQSYGGAVYLAYGQKLNIEGSKFNGNQSVQQSGGMMYISTLINVEITDTTIENNSAAKRGGAIGFENSDKSNTAWAQLVTLEGVEFSGNKASYYISEILEADKTLNDELGIESYSNLHEDITTTHAFNNYDIMNRSDYASITYVTQHDTAPVDPRVYAAGTTIKIPTNVLQDDRYSFKGWSTVSGATVAEYLPGDTLTAPSKSVTLYAVWQKTHYNLTFDVNGMLDAYNAGFPDNTTLKTSVVKTGEGVVAPSDPTQLGFEFAGWYTEDGKANNFHYYTDDSKWGTKLEDFNNQVMPEEDVTFYARWTPVAFEVSNEDELNAALSSNREEIEINLTKNIQLTNSMKVNNPAGTDITIKMSKSDDYSDTPSDGRACLTMTADDDMRHLYLVGGLEATLYLTDIVADSTVGYGGIDISGGKLTIYGDPSGSDSKSKISGINKYSSGGAIYVHGSSAEIVINDFIIEGNEANIYGGGMYILDAKAELNNVDFIDNKAENGFGGGIAVSGESEVKLADSVFKSNKAVTGGAIYICKVSAAKSLTTNVTFEDNEASKVVHVLGKEPLEFYKSLWENKLFSDIITSSADVDKISVTIDDEMKNVVNVYNNYDIGYTEDTYTIKYVIDSDISDTTIIDEKNYGAGAEIVLDFDVNTNNNPYYDFLGWSKERLSKMPEYKEVSDLLTIEENTTLYAIFKIQEISVKLNGNGGETASGADYREYAIDKGSILEAPGADIFQNEDKFFQGWADGQGNPIIFGNPQTEDIELYAQWDTIQPGYFQVLFDTNGRTSVNPIELEENEDSTLNYGADPTKKGYEFKGWKASDTLEYQASDTIEYEDIKGLIEDRTLKLTAQWEVIEYDLVATVSDGNGTVEFRKDDALGEVITKATIEDVVCGVFTPSEGYHWTEYEIGADEYTIVAYSYEDNSVTLSNLFVTEPGDTITITVDAELNKYDVSIYDASIENGGGYLKKIQVEHGDTINLNNYLPADIGHYNEWYTYEDNQPIPEGINTSVTENIAVYRLQLPEEYEITFDDDEATSDWNDSVIVKANYGTMITEPEKPKSEFKDFIYWYKEGTNTEWIFASQIVTSALTLKGKWEAKAIPDLELEVKASVNGAERTIGTEQEHRIRIEAEYDDKLELKVTDVTINGSSAGLLNIQYTWYEIKGNIPVEMGNNTNEIEISVNRVGEAIYMVQVEAEHEIFEGTGVGRYYIDTYVDVKAPEIKKQPISAEVKLNEKVVLSVEAESLYDNELSYQWYKADVNMGAGGTAIAGATDSEYTVPTNVVGSAYYYVVITDSVEGEEVHAYSDVAKVTVVKEPDVNPNPNPNPGGDNNSSDDRDRDSDSSSSAVTNKTNKNTNELAVSEESNNTDASESGSTNNTNNSNNIVSVKDFSDISNKAWYYEAVKDVVDRGLFYGITNSEFGPDVAVSRAMFVTVLGRIAEQYMEETIGSASDKPFADVDLGQWYSDYISWAADRNIIVGYDYEVFGPDDLITREQIAVILIKFLNYYGLNHDRVYNIVFNDSDTISSWAADSVEEAAAIGLVRGYPDGTFRPVSHATRAEVAQIISNYFKLN